MWTRFRDAVVHQLPAGWEAQVRQGMEAARSPLRDPRTVAGLAVFWLLVVETGPVYDQMSASLTLAAGPAGRLSYRDMLADGSMILPRALAACREGICGSADRSADAVRLDEVLGRLLGENVSQLRATLATFDDASRPVDIDVHGVCRWLITQVLRSCMVELARACTRIPGDLAAVQPLANAVLRVLTLARMDTSRDQVALLESEPIAEPAARPAPLGAPPAASATATSATPATAAAAPSAPRRPPRSHKLPRSQMDRTVFYVAARDGPILEHIHELAVRVEDARMLTITLQQDDLRDRLRAQLEQALVTLMDTMDRKLLDDQTRQRCAVSLRSIRLALEAVVDMEAGLADPVFAQSIVSEYEQSVVGAPASKPRRHHRSRA